MELRMGKDGTVFQGNYSAPMVEDYNLQELSTREDAQVLKDRQKLKNQKINQARLIQKRANQIQNQNALKKKVYDQKATKLQAVQNNLVKARNMQTDLLKGHAISQANMEYEQLSGVSGHGLTSDGHVPLYDRPARDYAYIKNTDEAFGSNTMGQVSSKDIIPFAPTGKGSVLPGTGIMTKTGADLPLYSPPFYQPGLTPATKKLLPAPVPSSMPAPMPTPAPRPVAAPMPTNEFKATVQPSPVLTPVKGTALKRGSQISLLHPMLIAGLIPKRK